MEILKDRPYVVCHLVSTIDGRIDGDFYRTEEFRRAYPAANEIRSGYDCQAVMNGAVTSAEIYAEGFLKAPGKSSSHFSRTDYIAPTQLRRFVVCVDTEGRLSWRGNTVERPSMPLSHVIEVLTETVSDDYLAYLREREISYIFAGKDTLDLAEALRKLKTLFRIDSVLLTGGGVMDWSFLQAGMLDELSLVIVPVADGSTGAATSFDGSGYVSSARPVGFELIGVKQLDGGALWLNYRPKNTRS